MAGLHESLSPRLRRAFAGAFGLRGRGGGGEVDLEGFGVALGRARLRRHFGLRA